MMTPAMTSRLTPTHRTRVRGFAIVSAIFILIVLAALGAFVVNISTNQQIGSALDVQGVRAYQAAKAGIEWGLYQQLRNAPCATVTTSSFIPAAPTLSGFTVTVTCTPTTDINSGPTVYSLTSTACNQPAAGACPNTAPTGFNYIERRMDVSL